MSDLLFLPIVFCDIARYSRLSVSQQQTAQVTLRRLLDEAYTTQEVRPYRELPRGDGYLLLYNEGDSDVALTFLKNFATGLQETLPDFQLRIGMHAGRVGVADPDDPRSEFFGPGIDRAHRVMECCDPGHILLSQQAVEDLSEDMQSHIRLAGNCRVKHDEYLRLYNFYGTGAGGVVFGNAATPSRIFETRRYNDDKKEKDTVSARSLRVERIIDSTYRSLKMLVISAFLIGFILLLLKLFMPSYFDKSLKSRIQESIAYFYENFLHSTPYQSRKLNKIEESVDTPIAVNNSRPRNSSVLASDSINVPVLIGEPLEAARRNCEDLRLRLQVTRMVASEKAAGTIMKQSPEAGVVASGHVIQVTISQGAP